MALGLYQDLPQAGQEAVTQQSQVGQQAAMGLFGKVPGAYQNRAKYNQDTIKSAIKAWGLDMVANWNKNSEEMTNALKDDMKQMRNAAYEARKSNDMAMYKIAQQRIMFDKEMIANAHALSNAKIGDIFTAIITGLGQLGAGFFTSDYWNNYKSRNIIPEVQSPVFKYGTPQYGNYYP